MIYSYKYIYGPVYSWRLGTSLGVDPLSSKSKVCNMNCVYCQLGRTAELTTERKEYVPLENLLEEIKSLPNFFVDYITFSGRGEPTLAKNLGLLIQGVKSIRREKVAVITNSALLHKKDVQDDLMSADFVLAKLDAANQTMLNCIDGVCGIDYDGLLKGMASFRNRFKGKFALQMMLIDDNLEYVKQLANVAYFLRPDEVQLNTPLRNCSQRPLGPDSLNKAKGLFKGVSVVTCYDAPSGHVQAMDAPATDKRHGVERKSGYVY